MTTPASAGEVPGVLSLADLTPYLSITVLECTGVDPDVAFQALQRFLRRSADEPGRSADVSIRAETALRAFDAVDELGELGFTGLYGVSRVVSRVPSWASSESGIIDVINLHLDNEGTLTAIHVKAADNSSVNRRIAVTRFEQVVSQAEKNIRLLANDSLIDLLSSPRISNRAAWNAGARVPSADFVQQLRTRVATDKTRVIIVQPHLLKAVHDKARADMDAGQATRDSYSLMLLDTLLHTTRRTVTGKWEDLTVIGCA